MTFVIDRQNLHATTIHALGGKLSANDAEEKGSPRAPHAVGRALAAQGSARNGLTVWCFRTPSCSTRGASNSARSGRAPPKILLHRWLRA